MTILEIEQLTIRIFEFFPKWKKARFQERAFWGIDRSAVKNFSFSWNPAIASEPPKLYPHQVDALKAVIEMMKTLPRFHSLYPPTSVMTPLGPIPSELRDKIVLAMDPQKDDLRNRESWLRTVRKMDGR
jgi:hypothetical protein